MSLRPHDRRFFTEQLGYLLVLVVVLIASFVLRAKYVFADRTWHDEAFYAWRALKIFYDPAALFSADIISFHPPLFSALLALAHFFFPPQIACQFMCFVFSLVGIWMVYVLGVRLQSRFVGSVSAILLALNLLYLRYSNKILMDGLVMVALMGLALALSRVQERSNRWADVWVGIAGVAAILLRWGNVLVVPWVVLYYFFALGGLPVRDRFRKLILPVGMMAVTIGLLLFNNFFQLGQILSAAVYTVKDTFEWHPWFFYFQYLHWIIGYPIFLPFLFLGGWFVVRQSPNQGMLLLSWLFVFMTATALTQERIFRYSLMFLPPLILLAGIGIEGSLKRIFRFGPFLKIAKVVVLGMVFLVFLYRYPHLEHIVREDNKFFNGFAPAGDWISRNARPDTLIIASSERMVRYHSRLHLEHDWPRLVKNVPRPDLPALITGYQHVIVEMDNWGDLQLVMKPSEDIAYLESLGFHLVMTSGRMRYRMVDGQVVMAPALWLFEKGP